MPSRRDLIRMTDDEARAFLSEQRTMNVASFNHDGTIHLVAMWYALDGDVPVFWTYGKSQKILNLQRDPRITCLVESGDKYEVLKGVELVGKAELVTDRAAVMETGGLIFERYFGQLTDETRPALEQIGAKRHVVRVIVDRVVSWDHAKLGGTY